MIYVDFCHTSQEYHILLKRCLWQHDSPEQEERKSERVLKNVHIEVSKWNRLCLWKIQEALVIKMFQQQISFYYICGTRSWWFIRMQIEEEKKILNGVQHEKQIITWIFPTICHIFRLEAGSISFISSHLIAESRNVPFRRGCFYGTWEH